MYQFFSRNHLVSQYLKQPEYSNAAVLAAKNNSFYLKPKFDWSCRALPLCFWFNPMFL